MSEFEKKNLNARDYPYLNAIWEHQLEQLGAQRAWGEDGYGWKLPADTLPPGDRDNGRVLSVYDAWAAATGTPTDLRLGMTKEPPETPYRKPV
jgi:hypothetical protein